MNQDTFINQIADKINDLGLTAPAVLLLEANKPLAFIGGQLLLVAQPTFNMFLPQHFTQRVIDLFEDPAQLEQLIINLETRTTEKVAGNDLQQTNRPTLPPPQDTSLVEEAG